MGFFVLGGAGRGSRTPINRLETCSNSRYTIPAKLRYLVGAPGFEPGVNPPKGLVLAITLRPVYFILSQ